MGIGVTLRVVETSKCIDVTRRLSSETEDIPVVTRRSGCSTARLGMGDVEERARLHRSAMLPIMLAFF